jgi:hypothetical protein
VLIESADETTIGKGVPNDHPYRIHAREIAAFFSSAERILSAMTKKEEPPKEALGVLATALNQPIKQIEFRRDPPHITLRGNRLPLLCETKGNYFLLWNGPWCFEVEELRYAAEALREYLESTAVCGPIHTGCRLEGCTNVVFGGRGNKKFCCDAHRKEFWSYGRQAEYFKKKQRDTYPERKVREYKKEASAFSKSALPKPVGKIVGKFLPKPTKIQRKAKKA